MSYSGLGLYQQQPPPKPPSRAPLWIALAVVGVLAVGGGVTAFAVLNSGSEAAPASSATTPTSTTPSGPDWQPLEDTESNLAYELPPSWESTGGGVSGPVRMSTSYVSRPFQCQGRSMIQAQAMAGSIADDDLEKVATDLVNRIAAGGYTVNGEPPEIAEPRVESGSGDSADADVVRVSVEVTPKSASACYAPKATVNAVALRDGNKTSVFVLNVAEGGPHVAEGPSDDDVERILESVRLS
ncbi:hypothetical protein ACRAKI_29390 [Saccharothrix isguenensis]